MINTAIIGLGKMGLIRAHSVNNTKNARVIIGYDEYPVNTKIDLAGSADEIINNSKIDAVFICTPNYLNKPLTIKALKAGKHVFCEKPPAFTAEDIYEIIDIEKISGKKLMYGLNHRHHDSIQHVKKIVDLGEFGKVLWMRGRYGKSVDKSFFNNWRSKKELAGGGIFMDQGIHMLDLFLYMVDDFDEVNAMVSNQYWKLDVEDNVFAILRNNKSGVVAALHSTMTQWRHLFSMEVFFEKGYCVLNGLKTSSNTYGDEILTIAKNRSKAPVAIWEDEEHITYHLDNFWDSEVQMFFSAIQNDLPIKIGNSQDALKLMKLVDKIYEKKNNKSLSSL